MNNNHSVLTSLTLPYFLLTLPILFSDLPFFQVLTLGIWIPTGLVSSLAKLYNANLKSADLSNTDLIVAYLDNADLSCPGIGTRAERPYVDLSNSTPFDVKLSNADADHADLSLKLR